MFRSEQELVSSITAYIKRDSNLLVGNRRIFTELDLGFGIADVVAVCYQENGDLDRKNFLQYFDISILGLIEKEEKVSFEDIVYITKSPEKRIHSSLASLIDEDLIVYRKGHYFSHKQYSEMLTDSIAVEAKLKDWKRALKQAYRYKWFADRSFVFLPVENIAIPKTNIHIFEAYNVGLASVSETSGIEIIFSPRKERPVSDRMRRSLNEHLLFFEDNA